MLCDGRHEVLLLSANSAGQQKTPIPNAAMHFNSDLKQKNSAHTTQIELFGCVGFLCIVFASLIEHAFHSLWLVFKIISLNRIYSHTIFNNTFSSLSSHQIIGIIFLFCFESVMYTNTQTISVSFQCRNMFCLILLREP